MERATVTYRVGENVYQEVVEGEGLVHKDSGEISDAILIDGDTKAILVHRHDFVALVIHKEVEKAE